MQLYDLWDFDEGNSPDRPKSANDQVRFANNYLEGTPFKIKSDWIEVNQTGNKSLDFFNNHDSTPKTNRVNQVNKDFKTIQDVKRN